MTKNKKRDQDGKKLKRRMKALIKENEEVIAHLKRARADFINYRKRNEKKQAELAKFATEGLLLKMLPVLDNLERSYLHLPKELRKHEWTKGFTHTLKEFKELLRGEGLEEINPLNEEFDPIQHEALAHVELGKKRNRVVGVVQKGYRLHEKIIRPAKVRVGK